jgi:REP element-mobilizing transposase RayT
MPNHIHGILIVCPCACLDGTKLKKSTILHPIPEKGQGQGPAPTLPVPDVVGRFKTMTTNKYIHGVRHDGWEPFNGKLWQRNYHEHIIRNVDDLNRIREYINNNPQNWNADNNNPNK